VDINVSLVGRLLAAQFPQWADLTIKPVEFDRWDNRTFYRPFRDQDLSFEVDLVELELNPCITAAVQQISIGQSNVKNAGSFQLKKEASISFSPFSVSRRASIS
jgi:hypothetical protein